MADKLFSTPSSSSLKAITINGAIQVESEEDAKKRQERRAKRKSRWDNSGGGGKSAGGSSDQAKASKFSSTSTEEDSGFKALTYAGTSGGGPTGGRDNPAFWKEKSGLMPATLDVSKMDETAQKIYLCKMQIQETSLKLNKPDLGKKCSP